jgi:hypothetical protein
VEVAIIAIAFGVPALAWFVLLLTRGVGKVPVDSRWKAVAQANGLENVSTTGVGLFESTRHLAQAGSLQVELSSRHHSRYARMFTLAVGGLGHIDGDLSLEAENLGARIAKGLGRRELEIGDPAFDDQLLVRGDPALAHAVLDAETRVRTIRLFADSDGRARVSDGTLSYERTDDQAVPRWLETVLPPLLDLARRLALPADMAGHLAANARHDPLPSVRLGALEVLVRRSPELPVTRETLRACLEDPSPHVRLGAASALGEEGGACLGELARASDGPEEIQSGALWALGDRLPLEAGEEILSEALRSRRVAVAHAVLRAFGRKGGAGVVSSLTRVLTVARGELAVAAAKALGECAEVSSEPALLAALDRSDEGVAMASAEALGRVGSTSAVPRLRELEEATGDDSLRRTARQAVAQIQARLDDASPGQLSLAEGESGQLSLTEDERGRVSLPGDDEGPQ